MTIFSFLWRYMIKILIGAVLFIVLCGALGDLGLLISLILSWLIHDFLWGPGYDYHTPVEKYEETKWDCYIPADGEENEWAFKTRYR